MPSGGRRRGGGRNVHKEKQKLTVLEEEDDNCHPLSVEESRPVRWAVGVSRWTLSFSNESLESEWSRLVEPRQRALWLRSLLSSVLYQVLRHAADLIEHGSSPKPMVVARLLLCIMELCVYAVARVELAAPRQSYIAMNATIYGMVELWLAACKQWPRVLPSHWIMLTYGVAWFVVPKMSALQFLPACCGSAVIVAHWLILSLCTTQWGSTRLNSLLDFWFGHDLSTSMLFGNTPIKRDSYAVARFLCRASVQGTELCADNVQEALFSAAKQHHPASGTGLRVSAPSWTQTFFLAFSATSPGIGATSWLDVTAGLALAVPVIVLFNVVAYSSEKSVKERFVLRSALSHEHNHDVRLALLSSRKNESKAATIFALVKDAIAQAEAKYARVFLSSTDKNDVSATGVHRHSRRRKPYSNANKADSDSDSDASSVASSVIPSEQKIPSRQPSMKKRHRALLALGPCALLAALGWFPRAQRMTSQLVMDSLGGADAAWAALTHVAGLTLFLLVVTRRVRFVFLTPLVCVGLLWLLAQLWQQPQRSYNTQDAVMTDWWSAFSGQSSETGAPGEVANFCAAACGAFGNELFALDTVACRACFDAMALQEESSEIDAQQASSPDSSIPLETTNSTREASLASALRLVGSIVLAASFLYALGLFAKMVRLFARLVQFSRRTLFLYPHLAKELVGHECSPGDEETLKKLVSSDRLPKLPGGPAAVRDALLLSSEDGQSPQSSSGVKAVQNTCRSDPLSSDDEGRNESFLSAKEKHISSKKKNTISPSRDANSDDSDDDGRILPTLAIGAHEHACSFCSRDSHSSVRRATHAVPVCSAWAQWYLARAQDNDHARRLASELGQSLEDKLLPGQRHRPCCDFSTLALDRADLVRENISLKTRISELERQVQRDSNQNSSSATTRQPAASVVGPPAGDQPGSSPSPQ